MTPPRRRSARLASSPVKGKTAPDLASVAEHQEPPAQGSQSLNNVLSSPDPRPTTPLSSAVKPPYDEMHPSKAQTSTAAPSSALRLGFTDIKPADKGDGEQFPRQDSTPSKIGRLPSSPFTFRIAQQSAEIELSEGAKQIMDDLREKAAKIKAELVAQREAEGNGSLDISERKFAQPTRKAGRFSAAHMAEFKKMDSIEGHPSAWRAQNGRLTPVKSILKRSPSKSNLDGTPTSTKSSLKRSASKLDLCDTPKGSVKENLKRSSSMANLDSNQQSPSPKKVQPPSLLSQNRPTVQQSHAPSAKRAKKRQGDDASNARPQSRDGSSIPRPLSSDTGIGSLPQSHSSLARLMSPTKSSLAHLSAQGKSTVSLVESPPKPMGGGLTKSATTQTLTPGGKSESFKRRIISPGRFQKVKSILRRRKSTEEIDRTAIPHPTASTFQTPGPKTNEKALPPLPLTTPRRLLTKKVTFTPDTAKVAEAEHSPTSLKGGSSRRNGKRALAEIQYPALIEVLAEGSTSDVTYPDLSSKLTGLAPRQSTDHGKDKTSSVPGTFTFRSDHTIEFGSQPKGFGAYAGQSSIRQVRGSILPTVNMPGSFPPPPSPSTHPNKENSAPELPKVLVGAPHGMTNKKRHRASSEEEDAERELAERAAKKSKKQHVPEGDALLAPRLANCTPTGRSKTPLASRSVTQSPIRTPSRTPLRTPGRTPGSGSPNKKRPMLSISRLNMLARPKTRT